MSDRQELFVCDCHSLEHMVAVNIYRYKDGSRDFCLQVTADNCLPWYRRIGLAFRYLLGRPGLRWHDVMLSPESVQRLQNCTRDYLEEP